MPKTTKHGGASNYQSYPHPRPGEGLSREDLDERDLVLPSADADEDTDTPSEIPDATENDEQEPDEEDIVKPALNASQALWVDWAVECGADREEAKELTRKDLIDLYGDYEVD